MNEFYGVKIKKPTPLVDAIRRVLASRQRQPAPRDRVYASEINRCKRCISYGLLGVEREMQTSSTSAEMGNAIHNYLEEVLLKAYPDAEAEVRVSNDCVTGRIDVLLIEDDRFVVVDIKTVGAKEWQQRSKVEEYVDQLSIYGAIVGAAEAVILLVNRDTGEMDELRFGVDYDRAERLFERAREMQRLARDGVVAEAERYGTAECRWCPFKQRCDAAGVGRYAYGEVAH